MGIFSYLGQGKFWHMRVLCPQFCPCFSFRLLALPLSVLVYSASQIPNTFTPWTLMNFTERAVNPVLLCHIKPAHVHILCAWWKYRETDAYLKLYAPESSTCHPGTCIFSWPILDCSMLSFLSHPAIHWGTVFNKAVSILDPRGAQHVVWSGLYLCCKLSFCDSLTANTVRQGFRKTNYHVFKETVNRIPWETAFWDKWVKQSWQILSKVFRRAQELIIPRSKKFVKENQIRVAE